MNRVAEKSTPSPLPHRGAALERRQWRQLIGISLAAVALYVTMRLLPTGTNLNHTDFRVQGGNSIEFCDAHNPQFIPVVAVRSPVTLSVRVPTNPVAGRPTTGTLTLRTFSGKPIAPADLLVVHTKLLHLMIVDPSLLDYQHVHPEPAAPGEWTFTFIPRFSGTYRLFADFTPIATARSLYANTDLEVAGDATGEASTEPRPQLNTVVARGGYEFRLSTAKPVVHAREQMDLSFHVTADPGDRVPLQPIMGAYAHLVAFDTARSGFAHLHPDQADPLAAPDPKRPVLNFKLTIPNAGEYVIWAQVNLGGREVYVPFWFQVVE